MLRHNVDHLVMREGQLFAHGWGFYQGGEVAKLVLCIDFSDKSSTQIDVEYGRKREDIRAIFPNVPEAVNSGFLLIAGFLQKEIVSASLRWELTDHCVVDTPLDLTLSNRKASLSVLANRFNYVFWKSISLLRSSGVSAIVKKTKQSLQNRLIVTEERDWSLLCNRLRGRLISVVVDHNLGGGANIYREKYVSERYATDETILVLGFHVPTLQYFLEVIDKLSSCRYVLDSPKRILTLVSQGELRHLMYNDAVSFRQPLAIINLLVKLKNKYTSCTLIVAVHDYYIICPSHFLVDMNGKYCGVPDVIMCTQCLENHQDGFVSLGGTRDINHWRSSWANLLNEADEVLMFSESSRRLLKKAYPSLNDSTWTVVPHILPIQASKVHVLAGRNLHIGVVGAIGKHKGAKIVRDLALEIYARNSNIKITVIGTLETKVPVEVVTVTGIYEPNQLAKLIQKSGANIFLLPSIVSETFSYVAHELVAMDVPFACFDIGAPADLARTYQKGLILNSQEASNILSELEHFYFETYSSRDL
jgi:hypothetical protein